MNKLESRTPLTGQLMMGPDGAVYDLGTGIQLPQRSGDGGQASSCFAYSAEVPRRDGGSIGGCFRFSAEVPRRDPGVIDPCFAYGAVPTRDPGVIDPCFAY